MDVKDAKVNILKFLCRDQTIYYKEDNGFYIFYSYRVPKIEIDLNEDFLKDNNIKFVKLDS